MSGYVAVDGTLGGVARGEDGGGTTSLGIALRNEGPVWGVQGVGSARC